MLCRAPCGTWGEQPPPRAQRVAQCPHCTLLQPSLRVPALLPRCPRLCHPGALRGQQLVLDVGLGRRACPSSLGPTRPALIATLQSHPIPAPPHSRAQFLELWRLSVPYRQVPLYGACMGQIDSLYGAPSPPSGGINCLKHFLDSRGGFCSLSPLFAFAWSPAWSQAPAGAANSGSPEGCPLPWSKDWGGSFPRAKNDLPRDAMTLPACPSAALHPPRAPPDVFIQGFYTCKPLTKRGLSPSPGRSDSLGYERLCSSPGLNTIPLCSKCPVHWGVLAEFGSILEHLKGLECIK